MLFTWIHKFVMEASCYKRKGLYLSRKKNNISGNAANTSLVEKIIGTNEFLEEFLEY